jgi:hypothetical protein
MSQTNADNPLRTTGAGKGAILVFPQETRMAPLLLLLEPACCTILSQTCWAAEALSGTWRSRPTATSTLARTRAGPSTGWETC